MQPCSPVDLHLLHWRYERLILTKK